MCKHTKLGIALDFRTKNITIDEINLLMRDINKLSNMSKIERAWSSNKIKNHEPQSTFNATKREVKILDDSYDKVDL